MNEVLCPNCNAKVNPGSKFCQECGTKLEKSQKKETEPPKFDESNQLREFYNIVGENNLKQEYIAMLSQENLNEIAGNVIKSKCQDFINKDDFTYENIATYEVISFKQYSYLLNVIAYSIINTGKEFKKRDTYEFLGEKEDKRKIIDKIKNTGENYGTSHLINKFVECAVIDNEGLSFFPNYVIGDNGQKFTKDDILQMIKHVYKYENTYGVSPKFVFASNKSVNNIQLDTSFENGEVLHDLIFDKINLMISAYSIQVKNALNELNKKVVNNPGKLVFYGMLMIENLDKNTHGNAIKNRLEDGIYALEITSDNIDDKLSQEIQNEVVNKKNKLKNKVYDKIGNEEISHSFLKEISAYNLDKEDAFKIKNEIVQEIDEKNIKESDYLDTFNKILEKHKIDRKHQILFKKLMDIINTDNSIKKLKKHGILEKKEDMINKIQEDILRNSIENEKDIQIAINDYIYSFERNDVKEELKRLDDKSFNSLMKKFSISSLIPLKRVKIEKLMDNISIDSIKNELINQGVTKYKHADEDENIIFEDVNQTVDEDDNSQNEKEDKSSKDNSSQNFNSTEENNQTVEDNEPICPSCGFKNRSSVKFCTQCGTKLN